MAAAGPNALAMLMNTSEGTVDGIDTHSADRNSEDGPHRVKWESLPVPAIQIICGYLIDRPAVMFGNYRKIQQVCKSLDAFRKTCSQFAAAVNSFLNNSANLPAIDFIRVRDTGCQMRTVCYMPTVHYLMHPLSLISRSIKYGYGFTSNAMTRYAIMCGSVLQLFVRCSAVVGSLARFKHLTSKLTTIDILRIKCNILGDEMSFDILELIKAHSIRRLDVEFYRHALTNPIVFITVLESSGISVRFNCLSSRAKPDVHLRPAFLALPLAFWQELLEKKRQQRYQIECDDEMIGGRHPRYPLVPFAIAWTRLP